ncbi:hypothetical protein OG21DRAFT_1528269 [Imleria badia]|nr:hypothetical protein OG21DRAFT_1528269 [Imleria badia]
MPPFTAKHTRDYTKNDSYSYPVLYPSEGKKMEIVAKQAPHDYCSTLLMAARVITSKRGLMVIIWLMVHMVMGTSHGSAKMLKGIRSFHQGLLKTLSPLAVGSSYKTIVLAMLVVQDWPFIKPDLTKAKTYYKKMENSP